MTQPERHWLDEGRHGPTPEEVASAITSCPAPAPAPTALRDLFAAAIALYDHAVGQATNPAPGDHHYGQADAALAVRDREVEQLRAHANVWRRKAIRRAIRLGRHETTLDAIREMAAEEITPQTPWGDGYRQALADLTEIIAALNPQETP